MSFYSKVWALSLAGVILVAGSVRGVSAGQQAVTTPPAAQVDDGTLQSRIAAKLKRNATMASRDIEVDVHEGVVTLKGVVRTADEKARAARLATIRGVIQVSNDLVVDAAAAKRRTDRAIDATTRAGEKVAGATKDFAQRTGEKAKEIAGATAKKTKEAVSATGEAITDSWITAKVKTKFVDDTLLKGSDIHVETNDHVVTLTGTVVSSAAKAQAAAIAGSTEGVTRVVNQLVVKET